MKRFSFSSLDQYEKCPLAFKYKFVERLKSTLPEKIYLAFGSVVHESLDFAFSKKPLYPKQEDVLKKYEELFRAQVSGNKNKGWTEEEEKAFFEKGKKILNEYLSKNKPENFNTVELEKFFLISIGDFDISGKIDRVDILPDSTFEVIDYKTGKMAGMPELKNSLQLAIYQIAAKELWKAEKILSSFVYLEYGGHKLDISHSKEEIEKFKEKIKALVFKIQQDKEFNPLVGPLCPYCDYRNICPAQQENFKKEQLKISF